jgi:SAM-dependent methyltransferase
VPNWIIRQTSNRQLFTLHTQLTEILPKGSDVLEMGCYRGEFLYLASDKIRYGLGLERSGRLVKAGRARMKTEGVRNIALRKARFPQSLESVAKLDVGVASLFFHTLEHQVAVRSLEKAAEICDEVIIADVVSTSERIDFIRKSKFFDRRNFQEYLKNGAIEGLVNAAGLEISDVYESDIEGVGIYHLKMKSNDHPEELVFEASY